MPHEHRIRITWSPECERHGLPTSTRSIDPVWPVEAAPAENDGWSLVYRFDRSPREQGNPSVAFAQFLMAGAPAEWLRPGSVLHLFERGTGALARVDVLD